jgi:site-specific DNA recombinase
MIQRKPRAAGNNAVPRCAVYLRCSADRQAEKDLSIPAQRDACRASARSRGWEIVAEFEDAAESGRSDDRPAFREMVAAARSKPRPFEYVIVWKFSRFARNREHSIMYKRQLERNGVKVISLNEPIEDSPAGRMLEGMLEVIDEFHSASLAQDVERGMRKNASMGFYNGGPAPVGYRKLRTGSEAAPRIKLEPDPAWSPLVQRMFSLVLAGEGMTRISEILNEEGQLTPRGRPWSKTQVHNVVTNQVYAGSIVWGARRTGHQAHREPDPIRSDDAHPALVARADFDRVQSLLASRAPAVASPNILRGNFLLSGLLFCPCGAPMIGHAAKGGAHHYYGCQNKLKRGAASCDQIALRQDDAERAVLDGLREAVLTRDYLRRLVDEVNAELSHGSSALDNEVGGLENQLTEARKRLDRLYDAVEAGALEIEVLAPRVREAKARVDGLTAQVTAARAERARQVVHLADDRTIDAYLRDLHRLLDDGTVGQLRAFLRAWVPRIDAAERELTVTYRLPPLPQREERPQRLAAGAENLGTTCLDSRATEVLPQGRNGDPNGN